MIVTGAHDKNQPEITARVSNIDIHPDWVTGDLSKGSDAAVSVRLLSMFMKCVINLVMLQILTLTQPIEFNWRMRPVCLPSDPSVSYENKVVKATGWGYSSISNGQLVFPNNLMEVDVKVIPIQDCTWSSVRRYHCYLLINYPIIMFVLKLHSHLLHWSGGFKLWNQGRRLRQSPQLS